MTPGILGPDYFREVAAILDAAAGGPPDFAALGEVMRRTASRARSDVAAGWMTRGRRCPFLGKRRPVKRGRWLATVNRRHRRARHS